MGSPLPSPVGESPLTTSIAQRGTDDVTARVLHPPLADSEAPIALLAPGHLVLYMLETIRRPRVFAFRTLAGPSTSGAVIPGVSRPVDLLLTTRTRSAAARIRNMLLYFQRRGIDPSTLSEDFWLRLGVLLNGRLRGAPHLPGLLAAENAP